MAPMTRGRSGHERIPNDMMLEYYVSRASAGLIITEGTSFSDTANGWAQTAAIETDEQVAGWKKITDAVHEKGGLMSVQLWHTGIHTTALLSCYFATLLAWQCLQRIAAHSSIAHAVYVSHRFSMQCMWPCSSTTCTIPYEI
jgi:2,4-dienoyl-CoA reductase-like NADH-dependent reductase (Old Yellow Enzyme family)